MKSDKMLYVIYADFESLIRRIDGYANSPKILQKQKYVNIFLADIQSQQLENLMT